MPAAADLESSYNRPLKLSQPNERTLSPPNEREAAHHVTCFAAGTFSSANLLLPRVLTGSYS
jgi:hypothetical protein